MPFCSAQRWRSAGTAPRIAPDDQLTAPQRKEKPEIMRLFARCPSLHRVPLTELRQEAGEEWEAVCADDRVLQAFGLAVLTRKMRERGLCPEGWTETSDCAECGPIFTWPGSPAQVLGCPWCFNRVEGRPIPRPARLTCGSCRHFRRMDHPHPGHCLQGEPESAAGLWDSVARGCLKWLPSENYQREISNGEKA